MSTADWIERGRGLGCFPDEVSGLVYAAAWREGDDGLVRGELERILTRVHRMPDLNWLGFGGLMTAVDAVPDAPDAAPEDWTDALFSVRLRSGNVAGPAWLAPDGTVPDGRWDGLLLDLCAHFLPLSHSAKVELAGSLARDALRLRNGRGTLGELALGATGARFLAASGPGSPALRVAVRGLGEMQRVATELRTRAQALAGVWHAVLGRPSGTPRPLTLQSLRSAKSTFMINSLLADASCPATENLFTYLRCTDIVG